MKIALVSCVFPPEPVVSARTSSSIAEELLDKGHCVRVIAPLPHRPEGKLYDGYSRQVIHSTRLRDRYVIIHCISTTSASSRLAGRLLENLSFGITGGLALLFVPNVDVIYTNTWPILATGIVAMVAGLRRIPLVVHVKDLYPESLAAQGRLDSSSSIYKLAALADRLIARSAKHVVVISEAFRSVYRNDRGIPSDRIHVVSDWIERSQVDISDNGHVIRRKLSLPEECFLAVYGGNIGVAANVEAVVESFGQLSDADRFHLLIAGSGSQLEACRALASENTLGNVSFYSPWPKEDTSAVLRSANVLILPTQGEQSLASVPSKLISYMLAARPIIAIVQDESETAQITRASGCGWVVPPGDSAAFLSCLRKARELDAAEAERMGQAGRAYALEHYSQDACVPRVVDIIERTARAKR